MRIDKWKVALPVFVCATLCLYAAKNPENIDTNVPPSVLNTDDNVPPGVRETDWHAISDDFGFILQITKEPIARAEYSDILKSLPDRITDESRRRLMKDMYEVGRAQAVFYARNADKWYMVTTPPPPVGLHFLQR